MRTLATCRLHLVVLAVARASRQSATTAAAMGTEPVPSGRRRHAASGLCYGIGRHGKGSASIIRNSDGMGHARHVDH
jgi:hypothetical protein